jgi:O-succinylbenzoic acid--CoA ligase
VVEIDPWLARATARRPDGVALETPEGRLSYHDLLMAATRAASRLVLRGAAPGDRVGIALPPGRAFVVAAHACFLLRAPAMPVDLRLGEREREELLRGVEVLVTTPLPEDGGAPFSMTEPDEDEVALVVHTSGTTRTPRPVELTFGNLAAHVRAAGAVLGSDPDERWLCPMPLSHVGGLMVLVRSAAGAGTVVLEPPPFDAERVARLLREGDITLASLVPTMLARLLDAGARPGPRLRRILLGGGPAAPELVRRAVEAGFPVSQTYGLTEACSMVTLAEPGDLETAGRPLPGTGLSVAADGEIYVNGPTVVGEWDTLRTGDLGRLDDDGRLTVIGRKSDTIVTGGENVAPAEVEAVLEEHPQVAEAGVFARAHPLWGESVTARVVPSGEVAPTAAELRAHCSERLAGFKVPKAFELAEKLPRTASGKLLRRELT